DLVPYSQLWNAITPPTTMVMASTVNYSSGLRPDLTRIAQVCREHVTVGYISRTQRLSAFEIVVSAILTDLSATVCFTSVLLSNGARFAYMHPRVCEWQKLSVVDGLRDKECRQVNQLHHGAPVFGDYS